MKRVTEEFYKEVAGLDLDGMTAAQIDEFWQHLMFEQQMKESDARSYLALVEKEKKRGGRHVKTYKQNAAEAQAKADRANVAQEPFRKVWADRGGWERVFLVTNTNGHYHRSQSCSTCFPTTSFAWVPEMSDKTQEEAIVHAGHMACTVCWPDAPTLPAYQAAVAQHDAEEAAKATGLCPGSGQRAKNWQPQYASPRGTCPVCNRGITPTSNGGVRKHKTRLQEKIDAQQKDAAKVAAGGEKAMNRLHMLALKVDAAIHLLDEDEPKQAIVKADWADVIQSQTADALVIILKERLKAQGKKLGW